MPIKKSQLFLLSIFSGVILSLSWTPYGFPLLIFLGFIPLLYIEDYFSKNPKAKPKTGILFYIYPAFFLWNVITTWWICNSTLVGAILAIVANALLMCIPFVLFHMVKQKTNRIIGYISFAAFWIYYEMFHMNWDLTWSWLNLGNVFSGYWKWIQWYEYTGTFGGDLWIILINILIFITINSYLTRKNNNLLIKNLLLIAITVLLPIIISYSIYNRYNDSNKKVSIVVVQPNIDPWNEKFNGLSAEEQVVKMLKLAASKVDSTTEYVVFPETALTENIDEKDFNNSLSIDYLKDFFKKYPKLKIVIGASSFKMLNEKEKTITSHKFNDSLYYEAYNTAIYIDSTYKIQKYHKSKLVPGVEKMPFPKILKPLENLAINLGGTTGSLGTQEDRTPFTDYDSVKIAPVICYESIFGEFVSKYVLNGANIIFIITNDGWWGNTPGYKQHFGYGRLRAIETRRCIARSANTGISAFIDSKGDDFLSTEWWKPAAISQNISLNNEITFYVKYGDYICRFAKYLSILLIIYFILVIIKNKYIK